MTDGVRVVLVTGSRVLGEHTPVWDALDDEYLIACSTDVWLIIRHGDCPNGADKYARQWCEAVRGNPRVIEQRRPAEWDRYGNPAGVIRNTEMIEETPVPDVCRAFPRGKSPGTRHCIEEAKRHDIEVIEC